MAKKIVLDAKIDYPAACNAMVLFIFILTHLLDNSSVRTCAAVSFFFFYLFFKLLAFFQETLLVHKSLLNSSGIKDIMFELETKGFLSSLSSHLYYSTYLSLED